MGDGAFWALWIISVCLWGLTIGAVAINGITQVATGGPGFLPFERWLRKRRPASREDFVLAGAAQILQAFGLTLIAAPISFLGLLSTIGLTTGWHPPSPPAVPVFVGLAAFGAYVCILFFGMLLGIWAFIIGTKVNYIPIRKAVGTPTAGAPS